MPKRSDVLQGLSRRQRARREHNDLMYVMQNPKTRAVNPDLQGYIEGLRGSKTAVSEPDEPEFVVCMRVDLDHPILAKDNKFGQCVDCGCDIQFRPDTPPENDHLCICCAARRCREEKLH